ncbi:hypothetical protein [Methylococcus sp. Mc7]|uniref:hypothetical protein n=1 Tax=Methylococcus sp. Mc7 TaxID=2860258 RepID=UPI001C527409|nr:hypothetical protein [Methylococcus sp. Mc7]QXP85008.1 hypothetical protein KW115_04535 [Methylococcus sp. Mc7]
MIKSTASSILFTFLMIPASGALASESAPLVLSDSALDNITAGSSAASATADASATSMISGLAITTTHTAAQPGAANASAFGFGGAPGGTADANADANTAVSGPSITHGFDVDVSVPGYDVAYAASVTVATP